MHNSLPPPSIAPGETRPLLVHVIHRLSTGGLENGLVNLVNGLPQDRFRHAIVCLTHATDFASRIRAGNVQIFELHKREGKDPAAYFRFRRLLCQLRPAIVHTRNLGALDFAPVAAFAGVPVRIHGEHGWDAGDPLGRNWKYRILRRTCDFAIHRYVAVSANIADWLRQVIGIRPQKVCQIYNGVDENRFEPAGDVISLPLDRSGAPVTVIGTVGRLDAIKGLSILLQAIDIIVNRRPESRSKLRVVIVGDGPELERLGSEVEEKGLAGIVWLAGDRNDVPAVLRRLDVFALASLNEGISNTILEAMSIGLPVVATRVGGNGELLISGRTGELVPANCPEAFADALLRYLDNGDLRRAHGIAARERVRRKFSLSSMISAYDRLYTEAIEAWKSSRAA